jgi:ubiquinone biosynthesis protein
MLPAFRSFLRAFQVACYLTWHGMLFLFVDLSKVLSDTPWRVTFGQRLASLLESLGPTAIKMGQILSARPDLLPADVVRSLAHLQDSLRPFSTRTAIAILEASLGTPLHRVFQDFEPVPLSAASVAQVHLARLHDGRAVAVKIRRPNIERIVENDTRLLRSLGALLSKLPGMALVPVQDLLDETTAPLREQLDFTLELENNRRLRHNFAGIERVVIPATIDEYCSANVLVMEYVDGLQKIGHAVFAKQDAQWIATAGLQVLYRMIFIDGFVHADMHPGNFLIRNSRELVLLDTGLMTSLNERRRTDFIDFFFALVNNKGRDSANIIIKNSRYCSSAYCRERFESEMESLIARHSALKSKEFEITRFVYELADTQRRCGIRGSMDFMMTVLAMVGYDGICKQMYPECDFLSAARPYLIVGRYAGRPLALSF